MDVFLQVTYWLGRKPHFLEACSAILLHLHLANASIATHHVTRHNTPIQNILSTAPQLNISQKVLGMLPEDRKVMLKHVRSTIYN
jgi:hypothetical protein